MEQGTIFDLLYDKFQFKKQINLIELFAGYGSQNLAMRYLGVNYRHHKIVEWAVKSIYAYNDLHIRDYKDYSVGMTQQEVIDYLFDKGISMDYNQPMTLKQITQKNEEWQRRTYSSIIATNNLVDISRVHAKDLEMVQGEEYLLFYSFPCQDLSLAGLGKGMSKDDKTRSGLLWQVERILLECKDLGQLPNVLIMENVPEVCNNANAKDFQAWVKQLQDLGYSNFMQILNAKDYGIPQNRRRCFMVSILGEWAYHFPTPMKLKYRLKDFLEDNVAEKYYLSKKMVDYISASGTENFRNPESKINLDVARPLTTDQNKRAGITNYLSEDLPENYDLANEKPSYEDVYNHIKGSSFAQGQSRIQESDVCDTVLARDYKDPKCVVVPSIAIKNATKKGYLNAKEGDGIDISTRMETHRGTVQNGLAPALDTAQGGYRQPLTLEEESVYTDLEKSLFTEDGNIRRYADSNIIDKFEEGQMATTSYVNGYGHGTRVHNESVALTANSVQPSVKQNLRIRKLTPTECLRLMGVKDSNSKQIKQSDSSLYHLAGDSIVSSVLMGIFGELCGIDYKSKIEELVEDIVHGNDR